MRPLIALFSILFLFVLAPLKAQEDASKTYYWYGERDAINVEDPLKVKSLVLRNMNSALVNDFSSYIWKCKNVEELISDQATFPPEMGTLTKLKKLDLSYTSAKSFEGLEKLVDLEEFKISGCKQFAKIPEQVFKLKNLKVLDISGTKITSIPKGLEHLKELNIAGTPIKSLTNCPNLTAVGVDEFNLFGLISEIKSRSAIVSLSIEPWYVDPELLDTKKDQQLVKDVCSLTQLKSLSSYGNRLSFGKELGNLTGLEFLYLESVVSIPKEIGKLKKLQDLILYNGSFSSIPDEIGQLKELKSLDLSVYVEFPGNIKSLPKGMFKLKNLESLNLSYQNSLKPISSDISKLTSLKSLTIRGCNQKTFPVGLVNMKALTYLDCGDNGMSKLPSKIVGLSNLSELNLSQNKFTDFPEAVTQLESLSTLNAGYNSYSKLSNNISQLKSLKTLNVAGNKLTDFPNSLGELQSLESLDLTYNKMKIVPAQVTKLKSLKSIQFRHGYGEDLKVSDEVKAFFSSQKVETDE